MANVFNFIVSNDDLVVRFSCPNHTRRIEQIVRNLCVDMDKDDYSKKTCRYTSIGSSVSFTFDGDDEKGDDIRHEAVFFENTEYPILVRGNNGKTLSEISLAINDHLTTNEESKSTIISDGGELYGSLNFRNQVGNTDFAFNYKVKDEKQVKEMKFKTEVLSYKLDYRTDLKTIISDIEYEYAMLSASFLKDTYLSMRRSKGRNSELIWWQIFKSCYNDIIDAAKAIIDRPKRRLKSVARYERAERLAVLPREMENEYQLHKDNPAYLYRTEELILSHDTIENRFLKHALNELLHRFINVREHIMTAMNLENPLLIDKTLPKMESELLRLRNHSFFHGVGQFKGFSQDNLVMKQALGYKTIMEKWIELQQGYELEEGLRKLEVKEISDLYEIWCFIKVKNIVKDTLVEMGEKFRSKTNGREIKNSFIPQLVYGGSVSFINTNNVELVCVSYNTSVNKNEVYSAINGTNTMTTIQRPDIVLRLSKKNDVGMKYTYLFDAKYRIGDNKIGGSDVPPPDAIDQMHRYRDAIYYTEDGNERKQIKKEIIAGYVLFPGRIPTESLDLDNGDYYYQQSNRKIGIGAFPLRPDQERFADDGSLIIDANSTESALRKQIRRWLEDERGRETLIENTIPQKGLHYTKKDNSNKLVYVGYVKKENPEIEAYISNNATTYYTGNIDFNEVDIQSLEYFLPVVKGKIQGIYEIEAIGFKKLSKIRDLKLGEEDNLRVVFTLGDFITVLDKPINSQNRLHNHEIYGYHEAKELLEDIDKI